MGERNEKRTLSCRGKAPCWASTCSECEPLTCGCTTDARCPRANALWEAANAVYRAEGYDAWQVALGDYRAHLAGDEEAERLRIEESYSGSWPAMDRLRASASGREAPGTVEG